MPNEHAYKLPGEDLPLKPVGGVDYFLDPAALDPSILSRSEDLYLQKGTLDRRLGAAKIAQLASPASQGASHTFGTDAKYATFTPPLVPAGGWAAVWHFVATRPASGKTAYVMGSIPTGQTFNVLAVTVSDAGVITVTWRDSAGNDRSVACTAVADGTAVHLLAIFDAVAGTFTVYVNGASSGTPLTGLASTLTPDQTAGVAWTFGVKKITGSAVTPDTHFDGAHDGMTLWTLRGKKASVTLAETLRRHSARAWPSPFMDNVLCHFDMDEASGTVMTDRSNRLNHGTYVGTPTVTAPVALLSAPVHIIDRVEVPQGRFNVVAAFGQLFYEAIGGLA